MIDRLPEGWKETTLGKIVNITSGKSRPKKEGLYPVYGGNGILDFANEYNQENPTIIIGRVGAYCGNVFYEDKKFWLSDNALGIKNKEKIDLYFLYYKLENMKLNNYAIGGAQPLLTQTLLRELEIIIPTKESEQKAIASILSSFDEKIELLKEQNETLEQMAQRVFKECLSEKNSENWEYRKLNEVLEISSSKRIFSKEYVENGIPFYRSKEIIELTKKPNITTELYITEERFQEIKNKFSAPVKGDILLTSVGTLGVPYQVRNNNPFYFKDGNLTWFKNFSDAVSSDYVYLWLKLKSTQNKLNEISIGSTQKALTISSLKTLEIPVLKDKNKAQELFDFIKIQLDKVNYNYEQIQTLQRTRDTLLPKLMSGELRVKGFGA